MKSPFYHGIFFAAATTFVGLLPGGCAKLTEPPPNQTYAVPSADQAAPADAQPPPIAQPPPVPSTPLPEEPLSVLTLASGHGAKARTGDRVTVHYVGTLKDGTKFDSSRDRNSPFDFVLGRGAVIKGWDQGVVGMEVGEKRKLVIPPSLGYGSRGSPPKIPPNATLVFEIELLGVHSAP
jgi:FKBP-type peptidyl-prolyl cis-trans isomerase